MTVGAIAFVLSIAAGVALFIAAIAHEACAVADEASPTTRAEFAAVDKLPTDAATRAGMEAIRARVIDAHTLITHRRLPVAVARQFASALQKETELIAKVRSEKVPPPDALEPLLKRIAHGGSTVAGDVEGRDPIDGLVEIVGALESYAKTFEHPDWRGLQPQ